VGGEEPLDDGDQRQCLCFVAGEHVHVQGEPARIDEEADLDLGVHPVFLGVAHAPGLEVDGGAGFIDLHLEVERRGVVHHQGQGAFAAGVSEALLSQLLPVLASVDPLEHPVDRRRRWGSDADAFQDTDRVNLRGRLHNPGQHDLHEHVITQHVEPEMAIGVREDLPQDLGRLTHHHTTGSSRSRWLAPTRPLVGNLQWPRPVRHRLHLCRPRQLSQIKRPLVGVD
jgi:hypothetical protein